MGDARTTFNGRALVVIQPAAAGDLVLRAEAEGLQAAEVAFFLRLIVHPMQANRGCPKRRPL